MPEMLIEPGRFIVGDAGVVSAEVVLVSRRDANDPVRWVYLDIGRFGGLAETEGESIKYRIVTEHDGTAMGPVAIAGPTCDGADILCRWIEPNAFCRKRADLSGRMRLDHHDAAGIEPARQPARQHRPAHLARAGEHEGACDVV